MNALPLESPVFFIDRNSGGRSFRGLLIQQGLKVVLHDEEFPQTAADEDWLMSVGRRGWVVITGDNATTSSPLFLLRLAKSKTHVFIFHGLNGASAAGKANCIVEAHETIKRLIGQHGPPAIWRVGKDGVARAFDFKSVLTKMYKHHRL
jgi:PIN like domain